MIRPVPILGDTAASTRGCTFSAERFMRGGRLKKVKLEFAKNQQNTLRIRLWICPSITTRTSVSGAATPVSAVQPTGGRSLFAGSGNVDYRVGNDNSLDEEFDVEIPRGSYLCVDSDNTDTSVKTFNVTYYVED
jgi:hypothetical protein